jgi:hypothetical protein
MHFYETCPFTICTHNTPNVMHTLGQVQTHKLFYAQILHTPCAVSALTAVDVVQYTPNKQRSIKNTIKRRSMLPMHKGKP